MDKRYLHQLVLLANHLDSIGKLEVADVIDELIKEAIKKKKEPKKPPKKWWDKMVKEIKKANPDYSEERVSRTIGDIWFNNIKEKKRKEILKKYK